MPWREDRHCHLSIAHAESRLYVATHAIRRQESSEWLEILQNAVIIHIFYKFLYKQEVSGNRHKLNFKILYIFEFIASFLLGTLIFGYKSIPT